MLRRAATRVTREPSVSPRRTSGRLRRLGRLWATGALAAVAVTAASALGWLEPLQVRTLDLIQHLGGQRFPPEVVIIAIDEAAFETLGARQPIPRGYLARVLRGLDRSGVAVVGLDIALSVPTTPGDDAALAGAIRQLSGDGRDGRRRLVLVDARIPDSGPLADPVLLRTVPRGSDRVPIDDDGAIRRVAALLPVPGGAPVPAFALAVLGHLGAAAPAGPTVARALPEDLARYPYWGAEGWAPSGGPPVALRAGDLWRINFVGPGGSFLAIPSDAVAELGEPDAPPVAEDNPLRDRIVLVGATFGESRDFFQTPVGRLTGVEVHANVVHMLATRSLIRPAGWLASLVIQLGVVGVAGLLLTWLRPVAGTLVALALTVLAGVPASYLAFHGGGYAVDFLLPVVVTCLTGIGAEALARRRFRDSFGRYVGRDVMDQVLAENPTLQGARREVSVLVSDLRGFTTLSETMPAEQVAAHLNEYFPAMIDAIFAERGMVNDFIGDGILAVFGAPLPDGDHAWRAARAAMAMQAGLEGLNREWAARGIATLRMGIGIHTGVVFAGNVGGPARIKYTVIGDTVNVTARLEGLNKDFGTTTLITAEVENALGDRVETRYRGEAPVKGRAEPLRVYELLAVHPEPAAAAGGGEGGPMNEGRDSGPNEADRSVPTGHAGGRGRRPRRGADAIVLALVVGLGGLWPCAANAADPVAVLAEIRPGKGEVRVKRSDDADWTAPRALQALRPGDQVRVTADGRATMAFTGGGSQSVTAANSPFTVQAPRGETGADRAKGLVAGVTQFLLGQPKAPVYQSLSVRAGAPPPRIVAPRNTRLLPGPVTFEWTGPPRTDYAVRLNGPQGLVWEQAGIPRRPLPYPAAAAPLTPGTRYSWTLDVPGQPAQRADFDVVPEPDAARIRAALADLTPAALGGENGSPLALIRAGLFFQEGLYADARRELMAAIAQDPDEPTLRQLLGYVYDRVGLIDLAAQEFDEAEFLVSRKP